MSFDSTASSSGSTHNQYTVSISRRGKKKKRKNGLGVFSDSPRSSIPAVTAVTLPLSPYYSAMLHASYVVDADWMKKTVST